jgi:hypothetical protein
MPVELRRSETQEGQVATTPEQPTFICLARQHGAPRERRPVVTGALS